uniref:UbiA prenyltransferase domain-containing protein 1 -like protein n=2 Tax=Sarcoptes scabiei TaxID=52283 RepID=A0A834RDW5_SARSC
MTLIDFRMAKYQIKMKELFGSIKNTTLYANHNRINKPNGMTQTDEKDIFCKKIAQNTNNYRDSKFKETSDEIAKLDQIDSLKIEENFQSNDQLSSDQSDIQTPTYTMTPKSSPIVFSSPNNHADNQFCCQQQQKQPRSWTLSLSWILSFISYNTRILSRAKYYLSSLRPSTLFTSLIPVLMGAVLASKTSGKFSLIILLATLLTVVAVHAAGNLVNTYCDFVCGIDSKRQSDDRTLVDSILTPEEVVNLGVLFYFIGCIGFLIVVIQSPARMELLALIYFGGLSSSFLYTGGGLKYIALGDIIIMITFGPVSVLYSYVAQTGVIRLVTLLYAIPLALNAEAILHSNNTRDIEIDRRAGCVTIAILIGFRASHILFSLLLFVPYILFIVLSLNYSIWLLLPLITLPKAFALEKKFRYRKLCSIPRQMAKLNFYFGMFYLFACFISPAHKLPGLLERAI